MQYYEPDCDSSEGCEVEGAELRFESLRPSMLETMSYHQMDSTFVVSAVGVLVDQQVHRIVPF